MELTRYSIEREEKKLKDIEGKNIMIGDVWISGVKNIKFEYAPIDDSIPEDERDGSEENTINICFDLMEGRVSTSFCPEREVCEVWFETDDLLVFKIQDTKKYIELEKDRLELMQKEYDSYMNS